MIKAISLVLICFVSAGTPSSLAVRAEQDIPVINYRADNVLPLAALISVGRDTRTPMAVLIGENGGSLCSKPTSYDLRAKPVLSAITEIVNKTGYSVTKEGGVIVVRNSQLTGHDLAVLNHVFARWSPIPTTMRGLGIFLSGAIDMEVNASKGHVFHVMPSYNSKTVSLGTMEGKSTEEIANQIVNANGKGVWIYRAAGTVNGPTADQDLIQVFSYEDPADARPLESLGCS
jgi:hypothetical protein